MIGGRAMGNPEDPGVPEICTLISDACTTGWLDWVHGELWLCPTGLIRRSKGYVATARRAAELGSKHIEELSDRLPRTEADRAGILADPKGTWLAWADVASVVLKRGIMDHSLHIVRADGQRVKYLWPVGQHDFEELGVELAAVLGPRFTLHRARLG